MGWSRSAEGVGARVVALAVHQDRQAPQDPPVRAVRVDLAGHVGPQGPDWARQARLVAVEDQQAVRPAVAVSAAGPCDVEEC